MKKCPILALNFGACNKEKSNSEVFHGLERQPALITSCFLARSRSRSTISFRNLAPMHLSNDRIEKVLNFLTANKNVY